MKQSLPCNAGPGVCHSEESTHRGISSFSLGDSLPSLQPHPFFLYIFACNWILSTTGNFTCEISSYLFIIHTFLTRSLVLQNYSGTVPFLQCECFSWCTQFLLADSTGKRATNLTSFNKPGNPVRYPRSWQLEFSPPSLYQHCVSQNFSIFTKQSITEIHLWLQFFTKNI